MTCPLSSWRRPPAGQRPEPRGLAEPGHPGWPPSRFLVWCLGLTSFLGVAEGVLGGEVALAAAAEYRRHIQPILQSYCYDCHGEGMSKGGVAFDQFKSDRALVGDRELWWKALKYLRAELMPPAKKPRPTDGERRRIEHWIKAHVFEIDPQKPDPGRVTLRRLNRVEYRNTIRDLMGIDFNSEVEFPADDTGYGFDDIGDVLSVSPMLLEKYIAAARSIVAEAVPTAPKVIPEQTIAGSRFRGGPKTGASRNGSPEAMLALPFYEPVAVSNAFAVDFAGHYELGLELAVKGNFEFDPGKCGVVVRVDEKELLSQEYGWHDSKNYRYQFDAPLSPGQHRVSLELEPLTAIEEKVNSLELRLVRLVVRGPMEKERWIRPKNYARFFSHEAPDSRDARRLYAREILDQFASKAFRRPADARTLDRLVALAEGFYAQPDQTFEAGIAHAMVAVLSSPRFLFLMETGVTEPGRSADSPIDEYSLASRLSYFLWSTMPDQELFDLAQRGQLRKNWGAQIQRMLADSRSEALIENFTGQWLQARDLESIPVDARVVLARDNGQEKQLREAQAAFRARLAALNVAARTNAVATTNRQAGAGGQTNSQAQANVQRPFRGRFFRPAIELDRDLRLAMKRETELCFSEIVHEDRDVIELIESDYTYLNAKLARLYGLTNLNVTGPELRRVALPEESPRGGILTQGSFLVVTSNPDRTSPVKRGLFVLDNLLGTPAPPPPANVPALEASEKEVKDHEPTLRETLDLHRDKPLCASCHSRMDPIGLGLENFNALGMWRERERGQDIDASGKLSTGESFNGVRQLKQILANEHRLDFYRCLTEKLLTYALGRGLEYYDVETVDRIVQRLDREDGRFSALLLGILDSAPFQRRRNQATMALAGPGEPTEPHNLQATN